VCQDVRYSVGNLEPGDVIDIEVIAAGRTPIAQRIGVARSARDLD
jgi:hypothetical protein